MSEYTTQLRWIIQSKVNDSSIPISEQITKAVPLIFDFDFPIWAEEDRQNFCENILYRYFNYEIAFETVGLWKVYLRQKLWSIMPNYIEYYQMTKSINFLEDTDLTTESNTETQNRGNNSGNSTTDRNESSSANSTNSEDNTSTHYDYPQSGVGRGSYESYADVDKNTRKQNSSASGDSKSNYNYAGETTDEGNAHRLETKKGRSGGRSPGSMLKEWRDYHINIIQDATEDLRDLFMIIW